MVLWFWNDLQRKENIPDSCKCRESKLLQHKILALIKSHFMYIKISFNKISKQTFANLNFTFRHFVSGKWSLRKCAQIKQLWRKDKKLKSRKNIFIQFFGVQNFLVVAHTPFNCFSYYLLLPSQWEWERDSACLKEWGYLCVKRARARSTCVWVQEI